MESVAQQRRYTFPCFSLLAVLVVGLLPTAGRAELADVFQGTRSLALGGAAHGDGTSNDAIFANPAGMSALRRYSLDVAYAYNNRDGLSRAQLSVVDSKTSPVAAGISYTHIRGGRGPLNASLHYFHSAVSYPLGPQAILGITAKHFRGNYSTGTENKEFSTYNGDVGLLILLSQTMRLGITYHNALDSDAPELMAESIAGGLALQWGSLLMVGDIDYALGDTFEEKLSYSAGAEYFTGQSFALRGGYSHKPFFKKDGTESYEGMVGGGAAYLTRTGALGITFNQSLQRALRWDIVGTIKIFL